MDFRQDSCVYGADELLDPTYQQDVAPSVPLQCNMFTAGPAPKEWTGPFTTSWMNYNFDFGSQMPMDLPPMSSQPKLIDPWDAQALEDFWRLDQVSFPGNRNAVASSLEYHEFGDNQVYFPIKSKARVSSLEWQLIKGDRALMCFHKQILSILPQDSQQIPPFLTPRL
jgi:hypothetical protein